MLRISACIPFASLMAVASISATADPSKPISKENACAEFAHGKISWFQIEGRDAYIIEPKKRKDPQRRWVWVVPFWLGVMKDRSNTSAANVDYQFYVDGLTKAGFYVVGVNAGTTLGSPKGAELFNRFYDRLLRKYGLNPKARLIGQSNGGLIAYAWAFRHPDRVSRILGIYPSLDLRDWPGLDKVVGQGSVDDPTYGFGRISREELERRLPELNPIDNLKPLADAGVVILHIHGEADHTVHYDPNSGEARRRYGKLGGKMESVSIPGTDHGPGPEFYESQKALDFLLADDPAPGMRK